MKIQICTVKLVGEVLAVIAQDVALVGITPCDIGLPGQVNSHTAR